MILPSNTSPLDPNFVYLSYGETVFCVSLNSAAGRCLPIYRMKGPLLSGLWVPTPTSVFSPFRFPGDSSVWSLSPVRFMLQRLISASSEWLLSLWWEQEGVHSDSRWIIRVCVSFYTLLWSLFVFQSWWTCKIPPTWTVNCTRGSPMRSFAQMTSLRKLSKGMSRFLSQNKSWSLETGLNINLSAKGCIYRKVSQKRKVTSWWLSYMCLYKKHLKY